MDSLLPLRTISVTPGSGRFSGPSQFPPSFMLASGHGDVSACSPSDGKYRRGGEWQADGTKNCLSSLFPVWVALPLHTLPEGPDLWCLFLLKAFGP